MSIVTTITRLLDMYRIAAFRATAKATNGQPHETEVADLIAIKTSIVAAVATLEDLAKARR
jgi:hypothetical protein